MKMKTKIATAEVLGTLAFKDGRDKVPALDPKLMRLLEGVEVGDGFPILRAWVRNWDLANLAAPVKS